jgi:hypothetical protein
MQNKRYRQGDTRGYSARHDDDGFDSLSDGGRPWKIPLAGLFIHMISLVVFLNHWKTTIINEEGLDFFCISEVLNTFFFLFAFGA